MTVVETPAFLCDTATALTEAERTDLISYLAGNPEAGDVMAGTAGTRKLRWRARGRGKRGGTRVIYYYHDPSVPLFLLNVFAKNEKANLTVAERNEIKALMPKLVEAYQKGFAK